MNITELSPSQFRQAANLKERIEGLQKELSAIMGGEIPIPKNSKPAKRGKMSAAGKAKIAAAQKLRWAKVRAAEGKSAAPKPAKKKFTMSAAAKAKISAAAKLRWAKIRAENATK